MILHLLFKQWCPKCLPSLFLATIKQCISLHFLLSNTKNFNRIGIMIKLAGYKSNIKHKNKKGLNQLYTVVYEVSSQFLRNVYRLLLSFAFPGVYTYVRNQMTSTLILYKKYSTRMLKIFLQLWIFKNISVCTVVDPLFLS